MFQKVCVIATFNTNAQIRPLWVQIKIGEESVTVEVISSVEVPQDALHRGFVVFRCRIRTGENSMREAELRYDKKELFWEISYDMPI